MTAKELILGFMKWTGHHLSCDFVNRQGPCSCGQAEQLRAIREAAAKWLEANR